MTRVESRRELSQPNRKEISPAFEPMASKDARVFPSQPGLRVSIG